MPCITSSPLNKFKYIFYPFSNYTLSIFLLLFVTNLGLSQSIQEQKIELENIYKDFNSSLAGIARAAQKTSSSTLNNDLRNQTKYIELISRDCQLLKEIDPEIEYYGPLPSLNERYIILEERLNFVKVSQDNFEFYIDKQCTKQISYSPKINTDVSSNIWNNALHKIYVQHKNKYKAFTKIKKKALKSSKDKELIELIAKAESKNLLIEKLYIRYINKNDNSNSALDNLSIVGHALFGQANFNSSFSDSSQGESGGNNIDINVRARYKLNRESNVGLNYNRRDETLLTSYKMNRIGAFWTQNKNGYQLKAEGNIETYSDNELDQNNYNKSNLRFAASNAVSNRTHFNAQLSYIYQDFSNNSLNTYDRLNANLISAFTSSSGSKIMPSLNYSQGTSDNVLFEYTVINPAIAIENKDRNSKFYLGADITEFSEVRTRNNSRYVFELIQKKGNESNSTNRFGGVYRVFEFNEQLNYIDVYAKNSSFKNGNSERFMLRGRYFPNGVTKGHLDLRMGRDQSNTFYSAYDMNIRLEYPTELSMRTQIDGYYKIGFQINQIRIGPFARLHVVTDLKNDQVGVFDSPMNNYQYGGEINGALNLENQLNLRFRASYDIGIHYFETNVPFKTETRNPSNIQLDADLSYKLTSNMELFGNLQYFKYQPHFDSDPFQPMLTANEGNRFKIGIRMRYN